MKITKKQISSFVSSIPAKTIQEIFSHYDQGKYDNTLYVERKKESLTTKRNALKKYLNKYIFIIDSKDCGRKEKLSKCILQKSSIKLRNLIINNYIFEAPLMHILSQKKINYEVFNL